MAAYRARLEQAINLPVVDPAQAAVSMAIGRTMMERAST
jgi:Asp/Glu/hydantoin racemase